VRTAILSDIHGNLAAFDAVLADLHAAGITRVVCLGDVAATGPQPCQTVERLRALNCPVVMGNTDEWLLRPAPTPDPDDETAIHETIDAWCAAQLRPADLDFLRTFRPSVELGLGGGLSLIAYHGSPRSNTEEILAALPDHALDTALADAHADVLAGGHTHTPMIRRYEAMLVINPGSVGLPFIRVGSETRNPPWAEYAIIDADAGRLHIELRRVGYDIRLALEAARASGMPHADWWTQHWDSE
jgi:predicted phosphodiesterase